MAYLVNYCDNLMTVFLPTVVSAKLEGGKFGELFWTMVPRNRKRKSLPTLHYMYKQLVKQYRVYSIYHNVKQCGGRESIAITIDIRA